MIAGLYLIYLTLDLFNPNIQIEFDSRKLSSVLKYLSILGCLAITALRRFSWNSKTASSPIVGEKIADLNLAAFLITLIADYFLLLTDQAVTGILIFCIAHLIRIHMFKPSRWIVIRVVLGVFIFVVISLLTEVPSIIAGALYSWLILNLTIISFTEKSGLDNWLKIWPHSGRPFQIAMVLFTLCDLCVAGTNLLSNTLSGYNLITVGMWLFYLPSQLLLATITPVNSDLLSETS